MDELLTTRDVAEKLKVHINTVLVYILSGKLKAFKLGGSGGSRKIWRIKEVDLDNFINKGGAGVGHTELNNE